MSGAQAHHASRNQSGPDREHSNLAGTILLVASGPAALAWCLLLVAPGSARWTRSHPLVPAVAAAGLTIALSLLVAASQQQLRQRTELAERLRSAYAERSTQLLELIERGSSGGDLCWSARQLIESAAADSEGLVERAMHRRRSGPEAVDQPPCRGELLRLRDERDQLQLQVQSLAALIPGLRPAPTSTVTVTGEPESDPWPESAPDTIVLPAVPALPAARAASSGCGEIAADAWARPYPDWELRGADRLPEAPETRSNPLFLAQSSTTESFDFYTSSN